PKAVWEPPTLPGRAGLVEPARRDGGPAAAPPLRPVPRTGEALPLSFAQERLWFFDQLVPGSVRYNIPAAVRLRGRLRPAALAASLGQIVRRHEALRTTFMTVAGQTGQAIALPAPFTLPRVGPRRRPT